MRVTCCVLAAALTISAADELRIRTIAGNGEFAGPVEGELAKGSPLGVGLAVAFGPLDDLHIATAKGEVWRLDAGGRWKRLWASEGGALLFGLAVDPRGQVFAGDFLSQRVYRIDPEGVATLAAGRGSATGALDSLSGMAVDGEGNLFLSEAGRIRVIGADGRVETYATGVDAGPLTVDRDGNLYLAHFTSGVRKIGRDRTVTLLADAAPFAVTACVGGAVYFTDAYRLQRIGAEGNTVIAGSLDRTFAVDEGLASDARFLTPLALACDRAGRVVVYDATAGRLRRIEAAGEN